ncbi:MAG: hypothetical protein ACYC3L_04930 [Gemmatimonadaceae bacterium]
MRLILGLLLGLAGGYTYGFHDGRHNTQPTVLRVVRGFKNPVGRVNQVRDSLAADASARLQKNADDKVKAAER